MNYFSQNFFSMKKLYTLVITFVCFFPLTNFAQWVVNNDSTIFYNAGNVGIGTASPAYKLDVNGDINLSQGSIIRLNKLQLLKADTARSNLFIGDGGKTSNAFFNTAIGFSSFNSSTTGNYNTSVGYRTLYSNTTGHNNTAIGFKAIYSTTIGEANTGVGNLALYSNIRGNLNSGLGDSALYRNTLGNDNAAIGKSALFNNTTGADNTATGFFALATNSTGTFNAAFGSHADVTTGNLTNATAIGAYTVVDASNKVVIGNTSITSIGGQVGWTVYSDERVKKDIKEGVPGLQFINALRPVTYHYVQSKENKLLGAISDEASWQGKNDIEKINFTGLLAQEVDAAAKKIGYDFSGVDKTGSIWGLRYSDFVVPLIKSVQELSVSSTKSDKEIDSLESELKAVKEIALQLQSKMQGSITASQQSSQVIELNEAARLWQNTPNPFSNTTTISYYLPANKSNAYINFYNSAGSLLKSVKVTGTGKGTLTVNVKEFVAGVYQYALVIDGKVSDSKQMMQVK